MNKFRLSENIDILPISTYRAENIPKKFQKGYFVLSQKVKKRDFLINSTIKYFLDNFINPQSFVDVVKSLKAELSTTNDEVEHVCKDFFDFLVRKKIIVEENTLETVIKKNIIFNEGSAFNGFIIQNLISERKEVTLYKVLDPVSQGVYVLKILLKSKTKNDQAYAHEVGWFEREFALLSRLEGIPAMCKAYSFKKNDEYAYIQIEYIGGRSLNDFLEHGGDLNFTKTITLLSRIVEPFASMHQHDMIHGDIHSSNILINGVMEVKIIDLGFSSLAELEKNQMMKSGGVTYYMPPERINLTSIKKYKSASASLRSDVYQIGLLMYLAVYQTLPFYGFIWEELATNIQTAVVDFPKTSFSGYVVPKNLIDIIKKCLERNPDDRFANAALILNEFNYHFYQQKDSALN